MLMSTPLAPFIDHIVEQRVGDRHVGGLQGAVLALGLAGAHHRLAHLGDHRLDVGEVEIDQARHHDQVGDAAHAGMQHLVGHGEGLGEGGAVVGDAEQVLVGDDDQGMDDTAAARRCRARPRACGVSPSKAKGLVTTPTVRMPASRTARAMTGAAPVPVPPPMPAVMNTMCEPASCSMISSSDSSAPAAADIGLGARAQAFGGGGAELDAALGLGLGQRLGVGVGDDELDAFELGLDHVVDGIAAGAAHAQHGDAGTQFLGFGDFQVDRHVILLSRLPVTLP